MATGITNGEIATLLFLSTKTIEHHVSAVLAKLQVRSRREAIQAAISLNLLPQDEGRRSPNRG
jgi:DNA-binding NarL/FixJ family response regulator